MSLFVWNPLLPAWYGAKFWHRGSLKEKVWPVYESKLPSSMNAYVLFLNYNYHEFNILGSSDSRAMTCIYIYCESLTRFRHKSCTGPHWGEFSAPWLLAASSLVQRAMGCAAQIISLKTFDMTPARENTNFARWAWHAMHVTDIDGSSWSSTIWMCHLTLHVPAEKCWRIWVGWSISLLHNACSHLPYPPAGLKPVWYGMDSPIPWWQNVILNSLDFRGMLISKFESNDL
jgi:hypothetical protein